MEYGKLVISIDFELHWGSVEKWDLFLKKEYFDTTRKSIPIVLSLFERYNVHATWATVGFLFANNKKQLLEFSPLSKPSYLNSILNYYDIIDKNEIGEDEIDDPYHYAPSLINKILNTPNQEIGTHTFAHYYCNEPGQTCTQFEQDLIAAQSIAKKNFNISLKSLVFPRNQFNENYLKVAAGNGIEVVRSNPDVWFWKNKSKINRLGRAVDSLVPISKPLSFSNNWDSNGKLMILPSSRFLRPYTEKEKYVHILKKKRILDEMSYAALNKRVYHLWWHPHNLANDINKNLDFLEEILRHYQVLNKKYDFLSSTMLEMKSL